MSDSIKHVTNDTFLFQETVHWRTCIVRATQSNCCSALYSLCPEPCPPTAPSSAHWLQHL